MHGNLPDSWKPQRRLVKNFVARHSAKPWDFLVIPPTSLEKPSTWKETSTKSPKP